MNANRHFDEDDLVLYAMRLLPAPQHAAMAELIAGDLAAQQRLAELQTVLGLYAEVSVDPSALPQGSRERLLERVAREPKSIASVAKPAKTFAAKERSFPLWAGWAIAALLAVTVGMLGQRWLTLHRMFTDQNQQMAALATEAANLRQQRDSLQASLSQEAQTAATLKAETSNLKTETSNLKTEATAVKGTAATLQTKLAGEANKLNEQTATAEEAKREQQRLQEAMIAQQDQLAQLSATTRDAQVLAALTDPTALRVVLTKPKTKPAPTGRAAYVASKGTLVFLGSNLAALKPSKVYELWIMPADGSSPVPAGTFVPDASGNANLAYAHFPRPVAAKGFAVTVENAGGSQVPTLPLVLAGL